jgi:hypothetical protein
MYVLAEGAWENIHHARRRQSLRRRASFFPPFPASLVRLFARFRLLACALRASRPAALERVYWIPRSLRELPSLHRTLTTRPPCRAHAHQPRTRGWHAALNAPLIIINHHSCSRHWHQGALATLNPKIRFEGLSFHHTSCPRPKARAPYIFRPLPRPRNKMIQC